MLCVSNIQNVPRDPASGGELFCNTAAVYQLEPKVGDTVIVSKTLSTKIDTGEGG